MDIKSKLFIAGKCISVERVSMEVLSNGLLGQNRSDENIIRLVGNDTFVDQQTIEQTLIHEVIHKINNILNLSDSVEDREEYVQPLSELLYQVFKQIEGNSDIIKKAGGE